MDTGADVATAEARAAKTPAARLRRVAAIVGDADLAAGDARVLVAVVAHANGRGRAWPGQRRLRRAACACGSTVARALRRAVERKHLIPAGVGPRGVAVWLVPDVVPSGPREDPPDDGAAYRRTGALKEPASVPRHGRADGRASVPSVSSPAYLPGESSVPSDGRETKDVNRTEKKEPEKHPPAQARTSGNADNGHDDGPDARLVAVYSAARGRPCRDGEAAKLLEAAREALAAGATPALVANAVLNAGDAAPWIGPNAARDAARRLIAAWAEQLEPPRPTVQAILADCRFAAAYLKRPAAEHDGAGVIRCEGVVSWAERHADALKQATQGPAVAPAQAGQS